MHRKVAAAALVAALALGVASCGGSETLTRAELVRKIEVACRDALVHAQHAARTAERQRTGNTLLTALLLDQREVMEKIGDLKPADEVKDSFEAFKQTMQDRIDLYARVQAAPRAELDRAMSAAQAQGEAISRRSLAAARQLGVTGCI